MTTGGRVSKNCKNSLGETVGRATNYVHGNWQLTREAGSITANGVRQLAIDACAPATNPKYRKSDWLLHKLLTFMFWTVAMVPPVLVMPVPELIYFRQPLLQFLCLRSSSG